MRGGVIETMRDDIDALQAKLRRSEEDINRLRKRVVDLERKRDAPEEGEVTIPRKAIYVCGIHEENIRNENELKAAFAEYGRVSYCKMYAPTGKLERSLARVEFEDEDSINRVLRPETGDSLYACYGFRCSLFTPTKDKKNKYNA